MVFYKHINTALVSCFVSVLFGYVTRMYPEKTILLLVIRFAVVVGVGCFWQYDEENRSIYLFLLIALNVGFLVSFWDEAVLLSTVYPEMAVFLTMLIGFVVVAGVYVQTKVSKKES